MKRNVGESYEDFRKRRLEDNQRIKNHLRGKLFFNPYKQFLGTTPEGKPIWSQRRSYRKGETDV